MYVRNSLIAALAAAFGVTLLAGCSGGGDNPRAVPTPAPTNDNGSPITAVITARFDPATSVIPFPNNLLLSGTRDLTVNVPVANANNFGDPAVALNALDGFSTVAPLSFTMSVTPAASTLTTSSIRIFEVTLTGPGGGVTGVVRALGASEYAVALAPSDPLQRTVAILPLTPLKQLTSYLVVVTDDVRDAAGNDATPDQTFFLATRTSPLCVGGVSTDPLIPTANACALEPLRLLTNSQLAAASGAGVARADIVLTSVFTTQSISPVLSAVRAQNQPGLVRAAPTGLTTAVAGLPPVADIFIGTLDVPYYLDAPTATTPQVILSTFWRAAPGAYVPPFNGFGLDPTSTNLTFANPRPVLRSTQTIPLIMTVPNAASGRMRPAAGWPVVIFQHGITRNRIDALAISATFASQGFVVLGIDQPLHGLDPTNPFYIENTPFGPISNERTFDVDLVNNANGAPGPDGVIDASGTHFINLPSLLTSRDNLRQSVSDLFTLSKSIAGIDLNGDGAGDLDPARIQFVGQSLGSIVGLNFVTLDPTVNVSLLSVPGGGIARLLNGSVTFGPRIRAGLQASGVLPNTPAFDQFLLIAQTVIDSADPINFAPLAGAERILLHEVVGGAQLSGGIVNLPDQVIPNSVPGAPLSGTEPLIRVLGLATITASTQNASGIRGAVRFIKGEHGSLLSPARSAIHPPADPIGFLDVTTEMQVEMASMIASNGTLVQVTDTSVIRTQ